MRVRLRRADALSLPPASAAGRCCHGTARRWTTRTPLPRRGWTRTRPRRWRGRSSSRSSRTPTSELHERFVTATSELRDRGGGAWCPRRGRGSDGRGRALKRGAGGIQGKALKRRAGPPYCTIDVCARVHAHPLTRSVGATSFLIFRLHLSLSLSLSLSHTHTHTLPLEIQEGRDVSSQYGRRDETCPVSTGGGTRRGLRVQSSLCPPPPPAVASGPYAAHQHVTTGLHHSPGAPHVCSYKCFKWFQGRGSTTESV